MSKARDLADGTFDTDTLVVDAANNRIGVGTASPGELLDVSGNIRALGANSRVMFGPDGFEASIKYASDASLQIASRTGEPTTFTNGTDGTERMRIDSSGNVGIGLTPSSWWSDMAAVETQAASGGVFAVASVNGHFLTNAYYDGSNWKYKNNGFAEYYSQTVGTHQFLTASSGSANNNISWSEVMRIDSNGSKYFGAHTSDTYGYNLRVDAATNNAFACRFDGVGTGASNILQFVNGYGQVGSVTTSGASTAFNTSSDYRLKTDIQPITGASARVQALNPVNFAWIASGERVDGFIAHEAQEVVPEAVSGEKDAMREEQYEVTPAVLDEDGNVVTEAVMGTREVIAPQGIDQSKLVPLLTAALQEALSEIADLKTRVAALETP